MQLLLSAAFSPISSAAPTSARLGVLVVVDQFRADYLMRFREEFKGGFKRLQKEGAYFPLADHGLLQNMTGPGHAALLTGAYPYRHGITLNYWYDRKKDQTLYCVQDDAFPQIGRDGEVKGYKGLSPKNLNATTVGDELKNAGRSSRVVSVSLKDRAAILMGGKRADHAIWFDDDHCQWVTSRFYETTLPAFVQKRNVELAKLPNQTMSWGPYQNIKYCSHESTRTPWAIQETLDLALGSMDELKLGQGNDVDLLLVSLSSHDYLGHNLGPNDDHMKALTLAEDEKLGWFMDQIEKRMGGSDRVFYVFTGDHGIPPLPSSLPNSRVDTENVPMKRTQDLIEKTLTKKFGRPKGGKWIKRLHSYQVYFDQSALASAKVSMSRAIQVLRPVLLSEPYLDHVLSQEEVMADRKVPPADFGKIVDRTLHARGGDMIMVFKPFHYSDSYPLTHMTHYSYDRYVPLIFMGEAFKAGTYRQIVNIADLAPTLSSVLEVIPPAQSEGRVLTEILQ